MTTFLDAAAHLFLGASCPVCRAPARLICTTCRERLAADRPHAVRRPGLEVPAISAHDYRPMLEKIVAVHKDEGALHLSSVLGASLARAVDALCPPPASVLVPVPSLPAAVRRRGMDHGRRIAARAARALGMRWLPLLNRLGGGADQRVLGRGGRRSNVSGSIRARGSGGMQVVVCDDVVTTGASLIESVRVLLEAGHDVVGAAVVADADRFREQVSGYPPHPDAKWVTLGNGDAFGPTQMDRFEGVFDFHRDAPRR